MTDRAGKKAKDQAMAAAMKAQPNRYPDSIRKPHDGCGADQRKLAMSISAAGHRTGKWGVGMFGGIIAARLGLGASNIPTEFLDRHAA